MEVNDTECKIIKESKIFDHIREKAKCFPQLAPPSAMYSPSTDTLNIARKRTREKQFESLELEIVEQIERSINARRALLKLTVELDPGNREKNGESIENPPSSENHKSSRTSIIMEERGVHIFLPKDTFLSTSSCSSYQNLNRLLYHCR